jgi:hypothetical protein
MQKLGMTYDPIDDFEHPVLPVGHPLRPHVLFRMTPARHAPSFAADVHDVPGTTCTSVSEARW